ncbi:hypothetical protein AQUCO_00800067v1 [Aquilegia coerulea]|uniref:Uncharacterized protein n=1 Tax=Aquilegia coerulea TaxID=218851 RepID=A0A2G5EH47_AQUCA|nr:hypothetical protein AQUCO_00800067v1 [Aquilegia coerulea]
MNWNCSSISSSSLSIFSQMQSHNIKFIQQNGLFFKTPKLMIPPHFQKKLHFLPNSQSKTHSIQLTPISKSLNVQCSYNTLPNNIIKTAVEKVAILLVGGLFFMGSFGCKPTLASPTEEKTNLSEPMEEIKDTQSDDELYLKILEKNPRDVDALKVAFSKMMMKGKRKEAVEYVERLIEVEPDEVEWRLLQALSYEMMGNLTRAKRLFKEILMEKPLLLRALHGLAMVMHKNREGPAVFVMLNKALELAQREKRVTEERNIRILIAQMHVVNVRPYSLWCINFNQSVAG